MLTGIPILEEFAKHVRNKVIKNNLQAIPRSPLDHIFTKDEKIELITRELVQGYKEETGERIVEDIELEEVLFDVVYLLFGSRKTGVIARSGESMGSEKGWSCLVQ